MADECREHEREAHEAGDEYYHVMTDWLTRGRSSMEHKKKAFFLARAYHRALGLWRRCLESFRSRPMAQKIEHASSLQEMLEKDLEVLSPRSPRGDET